MYPPGPFAHTGHGLIAGTGPRVLPAGAGGAGAPEIVNTDQGQPVHQPGVDGTVGGGGHPLLDGRSRALPGQRVH